MAGEFVNNPLVAALGAHLGLSGLLGGGTEAATQAAVPAQITPPKSGATMTTMRDERLQESLSRPKTVARAASTRGSQPGVAPNMPGMMDSSTLMNPAVQAVLGQYGQSPESIQRAVQNASPDLFITNPAAQANHPVLSGMVERALEGLAFTHGGYTVGESLSNIAQGMLTAHQARAEKYNNQLMMPFAQASQVANLQGTNLHQQYEDAEAKRANAQAAMYNQMPEYRQGLLDLRTQQESDKSSYQAGMNHLKLQLDPRFSAMSPEHSTAFQSAIQGAGGLGKLSDEDIENWAQIGVADKQAAETAAKLKVKGAPSGATGGRGRGGAVDQNGFKIAATEYSNAGKALAAFDKETSTLGKTPGAEPQADGPSLLRGSTKWLQKRLEQRKQLESEANTARQRYESFAKPGSGMSQQSVERKVNSTGDHMMKVNGQWVPDPNPSR